MAAIDHGADAVYIGAPHFGARAAAGNSVEDIHRLCDYAHPYGVKVYVTVNTILYDNELDATRQLLLDLEAAGVDAILVQDMAILSMFNGPCSMSLHASTQTDNRTPEKVRWLRNQGFSRVVLARELSVGEIAKIHAEVPDMPLEVFVHGALCVSYSGLCYASQHCFRRSANRGECAQFCRMRFSLVDADDREIEHERYLLSLKDMNQSDHLLELIEAGATSFKIEGRLKDAAYVKNVTAAYSQRLDAIIRQYPEKYCRASEGHCHYTFTPDLNRTFNRGYTTYFLHGRQPNIASFDTPKAIGEFVGTVKELRGDSFNVAGVASFTNGDGLCFQNGEQLEGFRANRVEGNRIFPYKIPQGLRPGMRLYRNNDQEFERILSGQSARRTIPVSLSLRAVEGGFELSADTRGQHTSVFLPLAHQKAQKPPHDNLVRQLTRLGDTIYECSDVDIPDDFDYFIPNSQLSELRRSLVEKLVSQGDRHSVRPIDLTECLSPCETYPYPYLYNISNHLSAAFYEAPVSAYEIKGGGGPIMQCRHCLRYSLGYCVKHGGKRPTWREPLSLVLGDGRRFRLDFDCSHCQMNVYGSEK
jgi:putative protease